MSNCARSAVRQKAVSKRPILRPSLFIEPLSWMDMHPFQGSKDTDPTPSRKFRGVSGYELASGQWLVTPKVWARRPVALSLGGTVLALPLLPVLFDHRLLIR
jgi:hypothetical protein